MADIKNLVIRSWQANLTASLDIIFIDNGWNYCDDDSSRESGNENASRGDSASHRH